MKKAIICAVLFVAILFNVVSCNVQDSDSKTNESTASNTITTIDTIVDTSEVVTTVDTSSDSTETVSETKSPVGGPSCPVHHQQYHDIWGSLLEYIDVDEYFDKIRNSHENFPDCTVGNTIDIIRLAGIPRELVEELYYTYEYHYDLDLDFLYNATAEEIDAWGRLPLEEACPMHETKTTEWAFKLHLMSLCYESDDERFTSIYDKYWCDIEVQMGDGTTRPSFKPKLSTWQFTYAEFAKDTGLTKEEFKKIWEDYFELKKPDFPMYSLDFDKLYDNLDYYASLVGTEGYEYPVLVDELIKGDIVYSLK